MMGTLSLSFYKYLKITATSRSSGHYGRIGISALEIGTKQFCLYRHSCLLSGTDVFLSSSFSDVEFSAAAGEVCIFTERFLVPNFSSSSVQQWTFVAGM